MFFSQFMYYDFKSESICSADVCLDNCLESWQGSCWDEEFFIEVFGGNIDHNEELLHSRIGQFFDIARKKRSGERETVL